MDLTSVDQFRRTFLRLVGGRPEDHALTAYGEDENEVVDQYLTRGLRAAQRWMLRNGYVGWRTKAALTFTAQPDGSKTAPLPADFLRAFGDEFRSALVDSQGKHWGRQVTAYEDHWQGPYYVVEGGVVRLARGSNLPSGLYLDYHYRHPAFGDDVVIDFPLEARPLIPAEAANLAKDEAWFPRDSAQPVEIALMRARDGARGIARLTKQPRVMRNRRRAGNHW